jgi:hypothetical protein
MKIPLLRITILLSILLDLIMVTPVSAQNDSPATSHGNWNGIDFTVTVVARNHTIPETTKKELPWWQWGNTSSDAYLFSFTNPEKVDLLLDFSIDDGHPLAKLYSIKEEYRGMIKVPGGKLNLPSQVKPALIIWPREGDWLIEEKPNFNLEVRELDPESGEITWNVQVGSNQPGIPLWSTKIRVLDPHPDWGYPRFDARLLADPKIPYRLSDPLMPSWPYLTAGKSSVPYGDPTFHPVYLNFETHELVTNWAGFQNAGVYAINSLSYPPYTDFESPFAWYQFDPSFGQYPNLTIRSEAWPIQSSHYLKDVNAQRNAVRMSWTADTLPFTWRYSLTAIGNNSMNENIKIGNTEISSISYRNLPNWVMSNPWKVVTFVEATEAEISSEGIYDFSVEDNLPIFDWVNGFSSTEPDIFSSPYLDGGPSPQRLNENMRGEYSLAYDRVPSLYFSTIDNRIHLHYAKEGIWNLGKGLVLRTFAVGQNEYINGWVRERIPARDSIKSENNYRAMPGNIEEQLYAVNGYFIHSGANGVTVRKANYNLAGFPINPPVDQASWQHFIALLSPYKNQEMDPNNLETWMTNFPGESLYISKAKISDFRTISNGFRFTIDLQPGFEIQDSNLLNLKDITSGQYVITFNGQFHVELLTSAKLNLILNLSDANDFRPGDIFPLQIEAQNTGLQDANHLVLMGQAENGKDSVELGQKTIDVLSNETARVAFDWQPTRPGDWSLHFWLEDASGARLAEASSTITILPVENNLLSLSSGMGKYLPAFFVLLAFACLIWVAFKRATSPEARP